MITYPSLIKTFKHSYTADSRSAAEEAIYRDPKTSLFGAFRPPAHAHLTAHFMAQSLGLGDIADEYIGKFWEELAKQEVDLNRQNVADSIKKALALLENDKASDQEDITPHAA